MSHRKAIRDLVRAAEALAHSIGRDAVLRLLRTAAKRAEQREAEALPVAYVSEADAWNEAERLSGRADS